jgi:hypothetical protein
MRKPTKKPRARGPATPDVVGPMALPPVIKTPGGPILSLDQRRARQAGPRPTDEMIAEGIEAEYTPEPDLVDAPYEAHKLRIAGNTWHDIATQVNYPSAAAAAMAVGHYLQRAAVQQSASHQQEALALQVARYETILTEWWALGTTGRDEKAASILLRTLERLDRILRLTDADTVVARETLVVSADPAEYVAQLKAITEGNG